MRLTIGKAEPPRVIAKTYGRGSFLGLLSLPFAFLMASRGMRGWQESAGPWDDDAVEMARQGYRITSSGEYGWPIFGITYYKVTYERVDAPAD